MFKFEFQEDIANYKEDKLERDTIGSYYIGEGEIMRAGHQGSDNELEKITDLKATEEAKWPPSLVTTWM